MFLGTLVKEMVEHIVCVCECVFLCRCVSVSVYVLRFVGDNCCVGHAKIGPSFLKTPLILVLMGNFAVVYPTHEFYLS